MIPAFRGNGTSPEAKNPFLRNDCPETKRRLLRLSCLRNRLSEKVHRDARRFRRISVSGNRRVALHRVRTLRKSLPGSQRAFARREHGSGGKFLRRAARFRRAVRGRRAAHGVRFGRSVHRVSRTRHRERRRRFRRALERGFHRGFSRVDGYARRPRGVSRKQVSAVAHRRRVRESA